MPVMEDASAGRAPQGMTLRDMFGPGPGEPEEPAAAPAEEPADEAPAEPAGIDDAEWAALVAPIDVGEEPRWQDPGLALGEDEDELPASEIERRMQAREQSREAYQREHSAWQARQAQATESRAEQAMRVIEKVAPGVSKHQWAINAASGILDSDPQYRGLTHRQRLETGARIASELVAARAPKIPNQGAGRIGGASPGPAPSEPDVSKLPDWDPRRQNALIKEMMAGR